MITDNRVALLKKNYGNFLQLALGEPILASCEHCFPSMFRNDLHYNTI